MSIDKKGARDCGPSRLRSPLSKAHDNHPDVSSSECMSMLDQNAAIQQSYIPLMVKSRISMSDCAGSSTNADRSLARPTIDQIMLANASLAGRSPLGSCRSKSDHRPYIHPGKCLLPHYHPNGGMEPKVRDTPPAFAICVARRTTARPAILALRGMSFRFSRSGRYFETVP
jgi:hypothetical protein